MDIDAVGDGNNATGSATSASWQHVVGSGAVLYAAIIFDDLADHNPTATWNTSESMSIIADVFGHEGETPRVMVVFRLDDPTPATANVVISWTTAAGYAASSISLTGVHSTTQNDAPEIAIFGIEGTADPIGPTVAGESGDLVLGFCGINAPTGTFPTITTSGGTDRALETNAQIALRISTVPSATTVDLAWSTGSAFEDWSNVGVNVNASGEAPPPPVTNGPALVSVRSNIRLN